MEKTLKSAPAVEVVSLAEAKQHLRVDVTDDDSLIAIYAASAREFSETYLRRALITQTWDFFLEAFPAGAEIKIPLPPLQSIDAIRYLDEAGVERILDSGFYTVDAPAGPDADCGRVRFNYGHPWPSTFKDRRAVRITAVCGYGSAPSDVPSAIRAGVLLLTANLYENRQDVVTGTIATEIPRTSEFLFAPYRVFEFE